MMTTSQLIYMLLASQILSLCLLVLLVLRVFGWLTNHPNKSLKTSTNHQGTCSKDTCGAIDNVNDPAYNMQNIVKQSILVEEHIAEKNKYCLSCIVKHFQHIIGLTEEAAWMAGKSIDKYPYLNESITFYQTLFTKWLENKSDDGVKLEVLNALRERRRKLIDIYFLH
jgi:hypothetical protein